MPLRRLDRYQCRQEDSEISDLGWTTLNRGSTSWPKAGTGCYSMMMFALESPSDQVVVPVPLVALGEAARNSGVLCHRVGYQALSLKRRLARSREPSRRSTTYERVLGSNWVDTMSSYPDHLIVWVLRCACIILFRQGLDEICLIVTNCGGFRNLSGWTL
jgi:hypothetical protein